MTLKTQFVWVIASLFLVSCGSVGPIAGKKAGGNKALDGKSIDINEDLSASKKALNTVRSGMPKKYRPGRDWAKKYQYQIPGTAILDENSHGENQTFYLYGAEHLELKRRYFNFPVVYNSVVKSWMKYFLGRGREHFIRYAERSGRYAPLLGKILQDRGLPRDLIFLAMAESGIANKARSWAGAVGPWQFMRYTGRKYGLNVDWHIDERRDPIKATISAAKYLSDLKKRFGSWELAAASYNAGEGKIGRAIRRYKTKNFWKLRKYRMIRKETKHYVPKIMALAIIGKNLDAFGFGNLNFEDPLDFDEIDVKGGDDLVQIAERLDIDFSEIHRLNPELMRWYVPISRNHYKLRVPVGKASEFKNCCQAESFKAHAFQNYRMRSNSSIRAVARKFKVPVKVLASLNNTSTNRRMKKGSLVLLPFRSGQSRKASMYADLYVRPPKRVRRWRSYKSRIKKALRKGKKIVKAKQYYTVRKGDTLWNVSRKTGVSMDTIIRSNYRIVKSRMIRAGDRLVIR